MGVASMLQSGSRVMGILGLIWLICAPVWAEAVPEPLERVVAVVDDDVVLESELEQRVAQFRRGLAMQGIEGPPPSVLRERAAEQLVVESLQLQLAERMGIRVSDSQLNETMANIAQRNRLSLEQFQAALESEGVTYAAAREKFRREMLLSRVQQRMVDPRVRITEKEVRDYLESNAARQSAGEEFRLGHILLALSGGQREADLLEKAEKIRQEILDGVSFAELAARYSDASTAMQGGDLGWRKADQLPALFAGVVPELAPGDLSRPLVNSSGVHLVMLLEKRGGVSKLVQQVRARHLLLQINEIRSDEQARSQIEALYQRLQAGESFEALARQYSDDAVSASAGGEMNWLSPGETVPEFDERIMRTPPGVLIPPFRTGFGWHIAEVLEVRETDIGQQLQEAQARQNLHRRRYEEELDAWLSEIRDEAFVQMKL